MRAKSIKGVEVVDQGGAVIGIVEDIDLKENGQYAVIVKGEVDPKQAEQFEQQFGASVGKDFFEIPQEHIRGVGDKVVLNKRFEHVTNIKILSETK
ncbi:MAG: PRC-barrel domain-containing protein [Candidatus Altiarchaeota archaeon]|nr:PRC-barrel domain-containing protein [Candidatus Altiarchaeota archaeon]